MLRPPGVKEDDAVVVKSECLRQRIAVETPHEGHRGTMLQASRTDIDGLLLYLPISIN